MYFQTGKLIWKHKTPSAILPTPVHCCIKNTILLVVVTLHGNVIVLSSDTGEVKWNTMVSSAVFSSPAIIEDAENSFVVVAEVLGIVHCFDVSNGEEV